jgi:hypothetical protein
LGDNIWFDLSYGYGTKEAEKKCISALSRLISLPHGPSTVKRLEVRKRGKRERREKGEGRHD